MIADIFASIGGVALALLLAPFLRSIINRTKARISGRRGAPLLQPYYSLARLLRKGAVYSSTSTWIFRAGPVVGLITVFGAICLLPFGGGPALFRFEGDLLLLTYLLAVGRFFTILAALDTGSSFEGMGANREAFFSALSEPTLLLGLAGLGAVTGSLSLTGIYSRIGSSVFLEANMPALIFILAAFMIVFLSENARIPVDDPTTHLELTMIHEAMILDHCGVDLAFIEFAGALKLWAFGLLITGLIFPVRFGVFWLDSLVSLFSLATLAVCIGIVESTMARLKMGRVPQLLSIAFVMSTLWIMWVVK